MNVWTTVAKLARDVGWHVEIRPLTERELFARDLSKTQVRVMAPERESKQRINGTA